MARGTSHYKDFAGVHGAISSVTMPQQDSPPYLVMFSFFVTLGGWLQFMYSLTSLEMRDI